MGSGYPSTESSILWKIHRWRRERALERQGQPVREQCTACRVTSMATCGGIASYAFYQAYRTHKVWGLRKIEKTTAAGVLGAIFAVIGVAVIYQTDFSKNKNA